MEACANNRLNLGYMATMPPLLVEDGGTVKGQWVDMYQSVGKEMQCPIMDIRKYTDDEVDALGQLVEDGSVLTLLEGTQQQWVRVSLFTPSTMASQNRMMFVTMTGEIDPVASLIRFTGYDYPTLLLVVVSALVSEILVGLLTKMLCTTKANKDCLEWIVLPIKMMFAASITLFVLFHSAIFSGNSIDTDGYRLTYPEMIRQFHSQSMTLAVWKEDVHLRRNESYIILGSEDRQPEEEDSPDALLASLCKDRSRVGLIMELHVANFLKKNPDCHLTEVPAPRSTKIPWLDRSLHEGDYTYYVFSKKSEARKFIDAVNYRLMSVYNTDNRALYESRREPIQAKRDRAAAAAAKAAVRPVSLGQLRYPLYIVLGVFISACAAFALEMGLYSMVKKTVEIVLRNVRPAA